MEAPSTPQQETATMASRCDDNEVVCYMEEPRAGEIADGLRT